MMTIHLFHIVLFAIFMETCQSSTVTYIHTEDTITITEFNLENCSSTFIKVSYELGEVARNILPISLTHLQPGRRYKLNVTFSCAGGWTINNTYNTETENKVAPNLKIKCSFTNKSAISLKWTAAPKYEACLKEYKVVYTRCNETRYHNLKLDSPKINNTTLYGLPPGTCYKFNVTIICNIRSSYRSSVRCNTADVEIQKVARLEGFLVGPTWIQLSWRSPKSSNNQVFGYCVALRAKRDCESYYYWTAKMQQPMSDVINGHTLPQCVRRRSENRLHFSGNTYTINMTKLKSYETYFVTVYPIIREGHGTPSTIIVTTEESRSGPVHGLKLSKRNDVEVKIAWNPPEEPHGNIVAYIVVIRDLVTGSCIQTYEVPIAFADVSKVRKFLLSSEAKLHLKTMNTMCSIKPARSVVSLDKKKIHILVPLSLLPETYTAIIYPINKFGLGREAIYVHFKQGTLYRNIMIGMIAFLTCLSVCLLLLLIYRRNTRKIQETEANLNNYPINVSTHYSQVYDANPYDYILNNETGE